MASSSSPTSRDEEDGSKPGSMLAFVVKHADKKSKTSFHKHRAAKVKSVRRVPIQQPPVVVSAAGTTSHHISDCSSCDTHVSNQQRFNVKKKCVTGVTYSKEVLASFNTAGNEDTEEPSRQSNAGLSRGMVSLCVSDPNTRTMEAPDIQYQSTSASINIDRNDKKEESSSQSKPAANAQIGSCYNSDGSTGETTNRNEDKVETRGQTKPNGTGERKDDNHPDVSTDLFDDNWTERLMNIEDDDAEKIINDIVRETPEPDTQLPSSNSHTSKISQHDVAAARPDAPDHESVPQLMIGMRGQVIYDDLFYRGKITAVSATRNTCTIRYKSGHVGLDVEEYELRGLRASHIPKHETPDVYVGMVSKCKTEDGLENLPQFYQPGWVCSFDGDSSIEFNFFESNKRINARIDDLLFLGVPEGGIKAPPKKHKREAKITPKVEGPLDSWLKNPKKEEATQEIAIRETAHNYGTRSKKKRPIKKEHNTKSKHKRRKDKHSKEKEFPPTNDPNMQNYGTSRDLLLTGCEARSSTTQYADSVIKSSIKFEEAPQEIASPEITHNHETCSNTKRSIEKGHTNVSTHKRRKDKHSKKKVSYPKNDPDTKSSRADEDSLLSGCETESSPAYLIDSVIKSLKELERKISTRCDDATKLREVLHQNEGKAPEKVALLQDYCQKQINKQCKKIVKSLDKKREEIVQIAKRR